MKYTETFLKQLKKIDGKAVGFRIDQILLPNGKKANREYLNHPGAVAVIPLLSKDEIVMVRQYRYPVKTTTWEIPAGKLDRGENPNKSVHRELQEETGYRAKKIKKLLSFWPTASFANEVIHIYVATGLHPGKANPDEDEFVNAKVWPLKKIQNEIMKGKIKDAKTLIALLFYFLQGRGTGGGKSSAA
jgi:ADP-ribose pyrophosphatase